MSEIVAGDAPILDIEFEALSKEIQSKITEWVNKQVYHRTYIKIGEDYARISNPTVLLSLDDIKEDYELHWLSEETEEQITLRPFSQSAIDKQQLCANSFQVSEYNLELPIATLIELLRDEFGVIWQGETTRRSPIVEKILELERLKNQ